MKIKQETKSSSGGLWKTVRGSQSIQIGLGAGLLLLAFLGGAFTYRSGLLRPLTALINPAAGAQATPPGGPVVEAAKNLQDELRLYEQNGLPTLYIDLKFKYYQQLLAKRDEAIRVGVLQTTDADFVPMTLHLQDGPEMDAKMRLKGDWTDHLEGDKWSFRIHMKDSGQVLRFTQFSIQSPETRNYLNEWAFHRNLIQEGILTTRYEFVNALLNGKLLGVYAIEENFAPELIESQGRRQGVIIRFDEDLYWDNIASFSSAGLHVDPGTLMVTDMGSAEITPFQDSKIAADPVLQAEAETAEGMLRAFQTGQRPASAVFDVEQMGRFFALTDLWGACHGVIWHNWRFYYNPVTALLEPVAYDNEPFLWCKETNSMASEFVDSGLFNDPQIRAAYARELARVSQDSYVAGLHEALGAESGELAKALKVEFPAADVDVNWSELGRRARALALELRPPQPVRGAFQVPAADTAAPPTFQVDLINLMMVPVDLVGFEIDGKRVAPTGGTQTLPPVMDPARDPFEPVRFTVSPPDVKAKAPTETWEVTAVMRLAGLPEEFRVALTGASLPENLRFGPLPDNPTLEQVLARHPFLSASPNRKTLLVDPGMWDVVGDLILPDGVGLQVSPGAVLRFEPGAILLSRGDINLSGTADAPVILTAQHDSWGGIVVLHTPGDSTWKYARVDKTAGIDRNGWTLTGGITFFQSDLLLDHVVLGNNQTEDAINVIHSQFRFVDSEFENTLADALDSDFSKGEVTRCNFHDIGGDAVDVSGTTATVSATTMTRISDKGVSVGESSTITLRDVSMDTVGIGVASKDLSKAYVYGTTIANARFAALAAYIKKPVYGPAYLEAPDLVVTGTKQEAIAQLGSTIVLRGKTVRAVDLDVDKLYAEGVLGN